LSTVRRIHFSAQRIWPATLYGTLEDLVTSGWIQALDDPRHRPADESDKKRFYRLTPAGRRALAGDTDRLRALVKVAQSPLKPRPGGAA
jgi:DNA-binding PadR family transcriptional regulator